MKTININKKTIFKIGDFFIPEMPHDIQSYPRWTNEMDKFNGKLLKVDKILEDGYILSGKYSYDPSWCKKIIKHNNIIIGELEIFCKNSKKYAIIKINGKNKIFLLCADTINFISSEQYDNIFE